MSEQTILRNIVRDQFKSQDVQELFEKSGYSEFDFKEKYLELIKLVYGNNPPADSPIIFKNQPRSSGFPLDFEVDIKIFKISIKVEQITDGYIATVISSVPGFEIGKSTLKFVGEEIERYERVGKDYLGADYTVRIKHSSSFDIQLTANIWVDLPVIGNHKASFGPKWLIS
ncbi:hypothetical protein [Photorhabdus sp. SF281]|uniref:hypothetical protein n=1 Tax=Photorhabdus sp. SF281 TaxID=3459527 RepID=UPI004044044C